MVENYVAMVEISSPLFSNFASGKRKKARLMKRSLLLISLLTALLFCGCDAEEECWTYMPESHWILHADGMVEGRRLTLTFKGSEVEALDGSRATRPFTSDRTWDYHIGEDGYMHIYYTSSDSDGYSSTDSYELRHSVSEDGLTMTLVYYPSFGSARTYHFDRR